MSKALSIARACSPFGPVFGKELRTTARRKRTYLLRFFYLLVLMLILLVAWLPSRQFTEGAGLVAKQQAQAALGYEFFAAFAYFSIATMVLIGPILTATAIGSERLGKSLPVLLMTPISSWQIVAGKLSSRLLAAITLLGLSLPVLALVRLLGSVEISQMIGVLCVAVSVAVFSASLGLFFSAIFNRSYAVILIVYAILGILYLFIPIIGLATMFRNPRPTVYFEVLSLTNPFFVTATLTEPAAARIVGAFSFPWWTLVITHIGMALLMLIWTAALIRRLGRKHFGERSQPPADSTYMAANAFVSAAPEAIVLPPPLPEALAPGAGVEGAIPVASVAEAMPPPIPVPIPPAMDTANRSAGAATGSTRRAGPVSGNPVIWRERQQPLLKKVWMRAVALSIVGGLLLLLYVAIGFDSNSYRSMSYRRNPYGMLSPYPHIYFAIAADVILGVLICVLSATCVAGEKESNTWMLLLATPLTGKEIVLGKIVGILRRMAWPMILITLNFLVFTLLGAISPLSFVLIMWVLVAFNSIWLATGVWLSLRVRKVSLAVVANLLLPLLLYLGTMLMWSIIAEWSSTRYMEHWSNWYVPFNYLFHGIPALTRDSDWDFGHFTSTQFFSGLIVAGAAYLALTYLIVRMTIWRFDRIVQRAPELHAAAGDAPYARAVGLAS